jgi:hypothetical protein
MDGASIALRDRVSVDTPQKRQRQARSRSTNVATQITATTARTRPAVRFGGLEIAIVILAIAAAGILGVSIWSQVGSGRDATVESKTYGAGYPLHGGLAGPSRVGAASVAAGPMSAVDLAGHYGVGYPLHGGLAGPSQVGVTSTVTGPMSAVDLAGHYGPEYPLHGGLAGPSQVGEGD